MVIDENKDYYSEFLLLFHLLGCHDNCDEPKVSCSATEVS